MSFLEYRSYQFQPDKSRGQESDYIVMPNILVLVRYPWSVSPPAPCTGRSLEGSIYGSWVDSKFADIFRAALSQHHLSGFEIAQLEFFHLH